MGVRYWGLISFYVVASCFTTKMGSNRGIEIGRNDRRRCVSRTMLLALMVMLLLVCGTSTVVATSLPVDSPTDSPVDPPTGTPTALPTGAPTPAPVTESPVTLSPTVKRGSTPKPTSTKPTKSPTPGPTKKSTKPTASPIHSPTKAPTPEPTKRTTKPTASPIYAPTQSPRDPTSEPTKKSTKPTASPVTPMPTTLKPTASPTEPTPQPTKRSTRPSKSPTPPTNAPTSKPTKEPKSTKSPTDALLPIQLLGATLTEEMSIELVFSDPIAMNYDGKVLRGRIPCNAVLSSPEFMDSVYCRVSNDGLTLYSDLIRSSNAPLLVTEDGESVNVTTINGTIVDMRVKARPTLESATVPLLIEGTLVPTLNLALQRSACGNLYLSYGNSKGSAYEPFVFIDFIANRLDVSGDMDSGQFLMDLLYERLDIRRQRSVLSRYHLDASFFTGRRYAIQMLIENWLGFTAFGPSIQIRLSAVGDPTNVENRRIEVLNFPLSETSDGGRSEYQLSAPSVPVSLFSDFFLEVVSVFPDEPCLNLTIPSEGQGSGKFPKWQFLSGPFPSKFRPQQYRGNQYKLMVLSGQLGVGNYTFGVQLTADPIDTLSATVAIELGFVPMVTGGNRTMNTNETATLAITGLDLGSLVAKDDELGVAGIDPSFRWKCQQRIRLEDEGPDDYYLEELETTGCTGELLQELRSQNGPNVTFFANLLDLDKIYFFDVDISLTPGGAVIAAAPSYLYRVDASGAFSIEVSVKNEPLARSKVNVNSGISIKATSKAKSVQYTWVMTEGDLPDDIQEMLLVNKRVLVLPPYVLTADVKYTFRVSAVATPFLFATVSFVGNGPPRGGFLGVTPAVGIATQTDFQLEASLFMDDDLPLTYSFLVTRRNCKKVFCFANGNNLFTTLSPFFPDTVISTQLEYHASEQTLGVVAQDSLGAITEIVLANATVTVTRPVATVDEMKLLLKQATSNPEDGSKTWTDMLSALSVFPPGLNDSSLINNLVTALNISKQAADFAPKKISSLVIENRVPLTIATGFSEVLQSSPEVLQSTVSSVGSVLDRAHDVLTKSMTASGGLAEGDADMVSSLTTDSLQSSSAILDSIVNTTSNFTNSENNNNNVSIPEAILAKLVRVQMEMPTFSTTSSPTSSTGARTFSSKNIQATFVSKYYQDLQASSAEESEAGLQVNPEVDENTPNPPRFVVPLDSLLSQLDEDSLAFASSTYYKVNPYAKFASAKNQSVFAQGVASLQVFDATNKQKLTQFNGLKPVEIGIHVSGQGRASVSKLKSAPWIESYLYNDTSNGSVTLRNATIQYFCGFWDNTTNKWSEEGCTLISLRDNEGRLQCACTHTTDYTAWVQTIQDITATFTDVSFFDDINNGWLVVVVLVLWGLGTIFFLILGAYWDDRDTKDRVRGILFSLKLKKLRNVRIRNRVFRAWRLEALKESGALVDSSAPMPPALSTLVSLDKRNRLVGPEQKKVDMSTPSKRMWNWFSVAIYREHSLLNTIYLLDAFLTRPMRVLCGAAVVLGEMFSSAVFFAFDQDSTVTVATQVLIAFIGILIVSPVVALFVLLSRRVMAQPGAQRRYLQQMMVILLAELGDNRQGEDVKQWAQFARQVSWEELDKIHRYQAVKDKLAVVKRTKFPTPQEKDVVVKRLQQELSFHREMMLKTFRRDSALYDLTARVTRKDMQMFSPNKSMSTPLKGSGNDFEDVEIHNDDVKTAVALDGDGIPISDLAISPNTYRWLQQPKSKPSPVAAHQSPPPNVASGSGSNRRGSLVAIFRNNKPESAPQIPATADNNDEEIATGGNVLQTTPPRMFGHKPPQTPQVLWTPRPFHYEPNTVKKTTFVTRNSPQKPSGLEEEEADQASCLRRGLKHLKDCFKFVLCKPVMWFCRSRPSSWDRQALPPPETDFQLRPGWMYMCYAVLFVYYAIAFFYVLSFGFRSKNEAVAAWLPTVAFSVFLDLILLQPVLIFIRFVLMNEIYHRLEGTEFVNQASGIFSSFRNKSGSSGKLLDDNAMDLNGDEDEDDDEDKGNNNDELPRATSIARRKTSTTTPRAVEPEDMPVPPSIKTSAGVSLFAMKRRRDTGDETYPKRNEGGDEESLGTTRGESKKQPPSSSTMKRPLEEEIAVDRGQEPQEKRAPPPRPAPVPPVVSSSASTTPSGGDPKENDDDGMSDALAMV